MKNKLTDLNDYLFAQLERLSDEDLTPEGIQSEVQRTGAVVQVADKIVANARLQLDGVKMLAENGALKGRIPPMLAIGQGGTDA